MLRPNANSYRIHHSIAKKTDDDSQKQPPTASTRFETHMGTRVATRWRRRVVETFCSFIHASPVFLCCCSSNASNIPRSHQPSCGEGSIYPQRCNLLAATASHPAIHLTGLQVRRRQRFERGVSRHDGPLIEGLSTGGCGHGCDCICVQSCCAESDTEFTVEI
jgi:hypothetical protein